MERAEFEKLVAEALRAVPRRFRKEMRNIAIIVEEEPSKELHHEMEIKPADTLPGPYHRVPPTHRSRRGAPPRPGPHPKSRGPHGARQSA